jgi:hypothetical protein
MRPISNSHEVNGKCLLLNVVASFKKNIYLILTFEGCKRPGFGGEMNLPAELRGGGSSSNAALANDVAVLFHKWLGKLL